ncbi:MAG: beta galactosidase jelly roll domain-containing protein [Cyclobacteriaceae bacterium]|nr:beta galactosidase jelly roll domain-containing protein [Cyclobacteriaceae bacterium]
MKNCFFLFLLLLQTPAFTQSIGLNGTWKFHIGDRAAWANPQFDDSEWEIIMAPSPWEDEGFNGYDGFAWYRKKFDGKRLDKNESYYLHLGYIDDCDEVYLNGNLVGFSGSMPPKFKTAYNNERKYNLSNDVINFDGQNVIAIRVFDVTLGGGIIEGKLGIFPAPKSRLLVDLQGLWQFYRTWEDEKPGDESDWKNILVPSPWEHQGYSKYDGNAWYKRVFSVSDALLAKEQDLVLLLGKIDDFDRAFLNGREIGKTNDGKRYGSSQSFATFRVYTVPAGLLKKGSNTLEVLVEDMGNVGGIYEGPVGITTRDSYERYFKKKEPFFWWDE